MHARSRPFSYKQRPALDRQLSWHRWPWSVVSTLELSTVEAGVFALSSDLTPHSTPEYGSQTFHWEPSIVRVVPRGGIPGLGSTSGYEERREEVSSETDVHGGCAKEPDPSQAYR